MSHKPIETNGVRKSYKDKSVLKGVDLTIERGTIVGVLGKNGAGKTTLIKCILGLLKIQEGSARVFGDDSWSLTPETKARIGYVPQKVELYPWMTVGQVINYTAAFYLRWNDELVSRLIKTLEVDEKQKISVLSGGENQKVGIILALGHEPDLIVLDEPVSAFDPSSRREFLSLALEVASNQERTILLSSHLTSDLERIADHVVILKDGVVDYGGSLDSLKDEVKQLRITGSHNLPQKIQFPGLLHVERDQHDALLSVRGVTPNLIQQLEKQWSASVEVRDLNLEDIFVEMHRE